MSGCESGEEEPAWVGCRALVRCPCRRKRRDKHQSNIAEKVEVDDLLGGLLGLLLGLLRLALDLVAGLLSLALGLVELLLAGLGVFVELVLTGLGVALSGAAGLVVVVGALLLRLLVLGAEEVGNGLEEVGGDLELSADQGENTGDDAVTTVVVLRGLGVLVCDRRILAHNSIASGFVERLTAVGAGHVVVGPESVALGGVDDRGGVLGDDREVVLDVREAGVGELIGLLDVGLGVVEREVRLDRLADAGVEAVDDLERLFAVGVGLVGLNALADRREGGQVGEELRGGGLAVGSSVRHLYVVLC